MVFRKLSAISALLALAGGVAVPTPAYSASAQQPSKTGSLLYCCRDAKNNRACGDSLPMQCLGRPYVVTGPGGKIVKQVEAPLTAEQVKAKEMLAERQKAEDEAKAEQSRKDKALLATYSSETEIDKARERAEKEIEALITQGEKKVAELEKKRTATVGDPELFKKGGVPDDVKSRLTSLDLEIKLQKELIESKKSDLEAARTKYGEDKRRYLEIRERRFSRQP
jgi:hypothetical protein